MTLVSERPGDRILKVSYYDQLETTGYGETWLYLDRLAPKSEIKSVTTQLEPQRSDLEILVNGVQFRPRGQEPTIREVYLGGLDSNSADYRDRLRLSVSDNEVLNPWFRQKNAVLRKQWGDSEELIASEIQTIQVDFLKKLFLQDTLKRGALTQMPTGTGKTEEILFFLNWLRERNVPYRLLWLVRGVELVGQTKNRFTEFFKSRNEQSMAWDGSNVSRSFDRRRVANGGTQHIFASMDSFTTNVTSQNILSAWMSQPDEAPVVVVMDESHQIGADTYLKLYEWLWENFQDRIIARIGLTATPFHYKVGEVSRFFGNQVKYAMVDDDEVDEVTGLPTVSFLEQLIRTAKKGYLALPLLYSLGEKNESDLDESLYTEEEMDTLIEKLRSFLPFKAMIFHQGGRSEEFGSTSRMRQFTSYLKETRPFGNLPIFDLDSTNEQHVRDHALESFRLTQHGILNLTLIGSTGLDIADTNLLVMAGLGSMVVSAQRIGRVARLSIGKYVTRIVDRTGENLRRVATDLSQVMTSQKAIARKVKIKKLVDKIRAAETLDVATANELYEVLGINPELVHADAKTFYSIVEELEQVIFRFRWKIRTNQTSEFVLPPRNGAEGLVAYVGRPDVHLVISQRLSISLGEIWDLNGLEFYAAVGTDVVFDGEDDAFAKARVVQMWSSAKTENRRSEGTIMPQKKTHFTVKDENEQTSPYKLPPNDQDLGLSGYLFRKDVLLVISQRFKIDVARILELKGGPVADSIIADLVIEGNLGKSVRTRLVAAWNATKSALRNLDGKIFVERVPFRILPAEAQESPFKLPPRAANEAMKAYLLRPDILLVLGQRFNIPIEQVWDLAPSSVGEKLSSDVLSDGETPFTDLKYQISTAWKINKTGQRRFDGSLAVMRVSYTVKSEIDQAHSSKLPPPANRESLTPYLRRNDVLFVLSQRRNTPLAEVWKLTGIQVAECLWPDISMEDETPESQKAKIARAWAANQHGRRRATGIVVPKQIEFKVRPANEQSHEIKLPPPESDDSFASYMRRPDVVLVIARRLGVSVDQLLNFTGMPVARVLTDDILVQKSSDGEGNPSSRIASAWSHNVRDFNLGGLSIPEASQSTVWPRSSEVQAELNRLRLLHYAVARHHLEALQKDDKLIIFFIGRDADDFLIVAQALAAKNGITPNRLRRLLLSRLIIAGNPRNPSEISRLSPEQLRAVLSSQSLNAKLIRDGYRIALFDVGLDGHVTRPVLASLLLDSGLTPLEFKKRVTPLFILSRPEKSVSVEKVRGEDSLDRLQSRWWRLEKEISGQWEKFNAEYLIDRDSAILKYLRSYGEMRISEIMLGDLFLRLVTEKKITREGLLIYWDSLFSNPISFRYWLESFVEGKGKQLAGAEISAINETIRSDLARAHGRLRSFRFDEKGEVQFEYENSHLLEAEINPISQQLRQSFLCREAIVFEDVPGLQ